MTSALELRGLLAKTVSELSKLTDHVRPQVIGRRVKVISEWRGDRRTKQTGKIYQVEHAAFSEHVDWEVILKLEGHRTYISADEVEFLDEPVPESDQRSRFDIIEDSV